MKKSVFTVSHRWSWWAETILGILGPDLCQGTQMNFGILGSQAFVDSSSSQAHS